MIGLAWVRVMAAVMLALLSGCDGDGGAEGKGAVASSLTKSISFPEAMLFDAPMPATTDPSVTLIALGPTPVLHPGIGGLMSLQVDDKKHRDVAATLMQFGGSDSHVRVPVPTDQSGDVVENEFDLSAELCSGLCDAIFTIVVKQKVELEDGAISAGVEREVVLDCRKLGDHAACETTPGQPASEPDVDVSQMLCGDVTEGEIALSGDPVLDSHLDAVRQLQLIEAALGVEFDGLLSTMSIALDLPETGSAQEVADALAARLDAETETGLGLLLGNQGCAVRRSQVEYALMACDPDGVASLETIDCTGTCEPTEDVSGCDAAASSGCRGMAKEETCDGQCIGACQVELDEPAPCAGTCIGECDGECPDDGSGACAGPCDGNCTGSCRETSTEECGGDCSGICDLSVDGALACEGALVPYCTSNADEPLACAGDCFGEVGLSKGSDTCRASAVSIGQTLPRCAPPLVQLSFGFALDLDPTAQGSLASLVQGLNGPLAQIVDIQTRLALLERAAADLDAASAGIADVLATRVADKPDDSALACASEQVPNASMWLPEEAMTIDDLQAAIESVLGVVEVTP